MSTQYSLNQADFKKIGKGALIAIGGALIPYLIEVSNNFEYGQYAYIVIPVVSILLNAVYKWVSGQEKQ